jgi:LysM repeat protein
VARRHGLDPDRVLEWNDLTWDDHPYVDASIVLQPVDTDVWVVRAGQGLLAIARVVGIPANELALANGLDNPDYIRAGQRLRIPGR